MTVEIIQGDCLEVLPTLPAGSVHCCVTSPPYWGLRDYGTASWEGGDEQCDHFKLAGGIGSQNLGKSASASAANVERSSVSFRELCGKCGAVRVDQQIGLERTPDEYVAKMVKVFSAVRGTLRDDGTVWLNLGDTYNHDSKWGGSSSNKNELQQGYARKNGRDRNSGCKPKDLVGIPWRVAFALQADGWYLRQDIIWHKPNPMPESVTDRCTKAHEYIFLLSKSERYYYNQEAIREPWTCDRDDMRENGIRTGLAYLGSGIDNSTKNGSVGDGQRTSGEVPEGRNKRSVWTVTTKPYKAAHFATFPPELIKPCILAGCPEGGTVLDPFLGSGTTALVADRNGCNCIGIELNPEYVKLAQKRVRQKTIFSPEAH